MFQSFDEIANPAAGTKHIALLRAELKQRKLKGFLVPRSDEHQSEYVPASAERLLWLTGFSGSAGLAIVLEAKAALFIDGRYTLQARDQVDTKTIEPLQTPETKPSGWLKKHVKKGDRIGYDPMLHTVDAIGRLEKTLESKGASLVALETNPLDQVWKDQPDPPLAAVSPHSITFAGVPAARKIKALQKTLKDADCDAAILTLPESIAWMLNIRGHDVPHTPLPLSFAILTATGKPQLFIAPEKIGDNVRGVITEVAEIRAQSELKAALQALGKRKARVRIDPNSAARWFSDVLAEAGANIQSAADPCLLPKALKNKTEIAGARTAHARDGVAVCRFLAWLDEQAPSGKIDEIKAAQKLEALRAESGELKDLSFDTISGAGPNGAIVHYRVNRASNRKLKRGELYLVDSGAQYLDGTTDITRTLAIGKPTKEMKRHFTLVLKGHIAIATARFPKGTRGQDLDPLARAPLWQAGLDFDHGTGHGVGSYLSVHEGPQRISRLGGAELEPGMICSNEPGFYREGKYGIRIENLVLVTPAAKISGGERPMMGFETLTLAPIDRQLIEPELLSEAERAWLNAYHARVRAAIGPSLDEPEAAWLEAVTTELS